ncbi:hypothetical protein G6F43_009323 [Rhizopus delemar]|nr:hypothetical protein G6F43_009323 [Rhizopus delemar]
MSSKHSNSPPQTTGSQRSPSAGSNPSSSWYKQPRSFCRAGLFMVPLLISAHLFHGDRYRKRQVSHCWRLLVSKWSEIAFSWLIQFDLKRYQQIARFSLICLESSTPHAR